MLALEELVATGVEHPGWPSLVRGSSFRLVELMLAGAPGFGRNQSISKSLGKEQETMDMQEDEHAS